MFNTKPLWSNSTSKRAWCFQETFLSPRSLYFQRNQIYWECRTFQVNESFPQGLNHSERPSKGLVTDAEFGPEAFLHGWMSVVYSYAPGQLTQRSDRLIALSGVAKLFYGKSSLHHDEAENSHRRKVYLAGLWREDLESYLLWGLEVPSSQQHSQSSPSWSWAKTQGDIFWPDLRPPAGNQSDIRVLSASTVLATDDPFGSVRAGALQLECNPPVPVRLLLPRNEKDASHRISIKTVILRSQINLDIELPNNDNIADNAFALHVRVWNTRSRHIQLGLLLQEQAESGHYRRIGVYQMFTDSYRTPTMIDIQDQIVYDSVNSCGRSNSCGATGAPGNHYHCLINSLS
jgi:hypothetical protein